MTASEARAAVWAGVVRALLDRGFELRRSARGVMEWGVQGWGGPGPGVGLGRAGGAELVELRCLVTEELSAVRPWSMAAELSVVDSSGRPWSWAELGQGGVRLLADDLGRQLEKLEVSVEVRYV